MNTTTFDPPAHIREIRTKQGVQKYMDIKWRILWLRSEHPDANIVTELVEQSATHARFKARIGYLAPVEGEGMVSVVATGHGSETEQDFPDFFEKAETKAIGRACAVLGYGTDAATDFDDETPRDGAGAAKAELRGEPPTPMEPRQRAQVDATYERVTGQRSPQPDGTQGGKVVRGPAPRGLNKAGLAKALNDDGWVIQPQWSIKQVAQEVEFAYDGEQVPTNESGSYWPSDIWEFVASHNDAEAQTLPLEQ